MPPPVEEVDRAFVIVNPAAQGGRSGRRWRGVQERIRATGVRFESAVTSRRGEATALARHAVRDGWPLVVAVGGDGTVNEVANGILDAGEPGATLGVIPTGRGRDVTRNFGIDPDPTGAALRLARGRDARYDVGLVEWRDGRRHFLNGAGAGFDAEVARRTSVGRAPGTLSYVFGVFAALRSLQAVPATVVVDGRSWSGRTVAVVLANGPWYGGGMRMAPPASVNDGRIDVVVFGDIGRLELVRWFPTLYRGTHLANPRVVSFAGREVGVEAERPLPVHVDGEVIATTPVRVSIRAGALRLRH